MSRSVLDQSRLMAKIQLHFVCLVEGGSRFDLASRMRVFRRIDVSPGECNWEVTFCYPGSFPHQAELDRAINLVQERWNLSGRSRCSTIQ